MGSLVCGRCGNRTAPNSTYCPTCRWTLFTEAAEPELAAGSAPVVFEAPRGGGFLQRRRLEGQRANLDRHLRSLVDPRLAELETQLEQDPHSADTHRALGIVSLLENHWERANAHLQRAQELSPGDFGTQINFAIVLAQRGQLQPAIELLEAANKKWPDTPLVLFNLAIVALQGRRAPVVLEAVEALERIWDDNQAVAQDYHDEALTLRGLAQLLQDDPAAARRSFEEAASHTVKHHARRRAVPQDSLPQATAPQTTTVAVGSPLSPQAVAVADAPLTDNEAAGEWDPKANGAASNGTVSDDSARRVLAEVDAITVVRPDAEPDEDAEDEAAPVEWQLEGKAADADLLNNLALAEVGLGDVASAASRLHAALRIDPGHTRIYNNLGVLAYRQGNAPVALKYLEVARQIEETVEKPDPATANHLGVVLTALGRLDEGMEQFQRAGHHDLAEFEVFYNLGRAYIEHGKPDHGVEHLRHAFKLNPNQADVHVVLGAAYLYRGKPHLLAEAMKHLKHSLQINHHHRIAFADLAMTLVDMDQKEGALRVLGQALKIHSRSPESLFLLALLVMDVGHEENYAQAAAQFQAVHDTRPDLIASQYNSALCQYLMGFRDAAAVQLQRVTERDPTFAPAYYLMGVGHAMAKRYDDAMRAWQTAAQFEPRNADLQANMGFIHYRRNEFDNAIKCYMQAHRLDPTEAEILSALGICFARANMLGQAITAFAQSLKLNPRSAVTHSNIGLAYYLHSQVEKAVEHWRTVSQIDARYASKREEEQHRTFDDAPVSMRPLNWRSRVIKLAPALPRPHTRLLPGYNSRAFRPALDDPAYAEIRDVRRELDQVERTLGWMNSRF